MHNFEYVSPAEAAPVKQQVIKLLNEVQDLLRGEFTFRYDFIGSSSRNMITRDAGTNKGYDFDINITVNAGDEYSPAEIKHKLMRAFDQKLQSILWFNKNCEDSTRVITIKQVDHSYSRILYSCDIGIVRRRGTRTEYIHYNKEQNSYSWKSLPSRGNPEEKAEWLRKQGHWNEVRNCYLNKKNENDNPTKHSRSLYAEAVHEVFQRRGGKQQ